MADHSGLDRRMAARVRAARVNVRNAVRLGKIPEGRIIEISEMPMYSGDRFDACEILTNPTNTQPRRAPEDKKPAVSVRRPKLLWRTRSMIALMVLRGELTVLSDSLTQFAPEVRGGRLVLGFRGADERDSADLVSG